ncbi:protein SMALL AUXIN UP-REGULATED RNA 12-like [Nicotiana tabacum]|uniref:Auxin-responsive protein SAUR71-like n=1 Tax=Nicotiana tabacum TaxID=4097 RepID=A0A1S4BVR6_TOBAC|nr:auxin-responsive protein SAUR50-like [Nicotiana tomentosiformis]XP_016492976.1 PREDICTED: auxin-responsive protein SAUR71-like [Nicotiana tabacum]
MASTIKRVHMITQIVRLKQVVKRWKNNSLRPRSSVLSYSSSDSDEPAQPGLNRRTPSGSLAVYVGPERRRFVIPTRFLNLPVFISLLDKAEEEFGFQPSGGLVLPFEVEFFSEILRLLEMDEQKFGHYGLDEIVMVISEVGFESLDQSCKEATSHGFAPLLQNARV